MKTERGSMEALIFDRSIAKTLCLQTNVTSFHVISLCISFLVLVPSCKSSFSPCSKLFVYLDIVIYLALSCLFVYF